LKNSKKAWRTTWGEKEGHVRASKFCVNERKERERESFSERRRFLYFFLSFFLSLERYLSLSLLLLRAFRRALRRRRRREKYHGDGKIIILVYRDLDGDHSSGARTDRRGLQPERFEMRQEMGRGAIVWVTFTTIKRFERGRGGGF
jgi:hypothetical protein